MKIYFNKNMKITKNNQQIYKKSKYDKIFKIKNI